MVLFLKGKLGEAFIDIHLKVVLELTDDLLWDELFGKDAWLGFIDDPLAEDFLHPLLDVWTPSKIAWSHVYHSTSTDCGKRCLCQVLDFE